MSAYLIAHIVWSNPEKIRDYAELAFPTLVAAGGKILAATDEPDKVEGEWPSGVVVLIEFPSAEDARTWLESPEYRPALQVRNKFARTNMILMRSNIR